MTTLLEIARAVQEACEKACQKVAIDSSSGESMYDDLARHSAEQCSGEIRSLDLSSLLAQFDDVMVVPKRPTPSMIVAGANSLPDGSAYAGHAMDCYAAMLAAAQEQRHD